MDTTEHSRSEHVSLVEIRLHLEHQMDGVEELARLLGIAVGEQLHRPLEVSEKDGHLFTFAFQGGLGGEDALGQVLRRR